MLAWKVVILHGNEWIPRMKMAHFGLLLLYQGNLLLSALSGGIPSGDLSHLGITRASFTKTVMLPEGSGAALSGEEHS